VEKAALTTVTLCVSSMEATQQRLAAALDGAPQEPRIAFATFDLLWKVITPKRLELLQAMLGQGALGVRELARRLGRDVSNVHGDVDALVKAGVIRRADNGGVAFPYDQIRLDVLLTAA
jgi:predicted transcriptional regulator